MSSPPLSLIPWPPGSPPDPGTILDVVVSCSVDDLAGLVLGAASPWAVRFMREREKNEREQRVEGTWCPFACS